MRLAVRQSSEAMAWADERLANVRGLLVDTEDLERARDELYDTVEAAPWALVEALRLTLLVGELGGRWDAREGGPLAAAATGDDVDPWTLEPTEAVRWWRRRQVVTADEFERLDLTARQEAFRVSGVTDRRLLQSMHTGIERALQQGASFPEFLETVDEAGGQGLGLHHVRTVFDTQLANAYMAGRYRRMMEGAADLPIWRYHAIDDHRTRPSHATMDGVEARHDDPLWHEWFPPNGFNCRCTVTAHRPEDIGFTEGPDRSELPPPDAGFNQSPAFADDARLTGDAVVRRSREQGLLPPTAFDRRFFDLSAQPGKRGEELAQGYTEALEALARSKDEVRLRVLRPRVPLSDEDLVEELRTTRALNFFPADWSPRPDELVAELHMYSQDAAASEAFARRLVYDDALTGLRTRIGVQSKVTVLRGYDPEWDGVAVVHDQRTTRALGDEGSVVAWSGETTLRLALRGAADVDQVARLVWEAFDRSNAAEGAPVPLSWWVPDLRFYGPSEALDQVEDGFTVACWINRRDVGGSSMTTLSTSPLPGWESSVVRINRSLYDQVALGESER